MPAAPEKHHSQTSMYEQFLNKKLYIERQHDPTEAGIT